MCEAVAGEQRNFFLSNWLGKREVGLALITVILPQTSEGNGRCVKKSNSNDARITQQ